ncbi:MAG: GNAT family N-acetyltransferase [Saprospiraceae bacterium]|nr:GNAT family N-acetyltransferase [Saprospiraceae bacterium]
MSANVSQDERSRQMHYRELCARHWLPLHFQPWWLDAVSGGPEHWGVCLSADRGGQPTAALPWVRARRWGMPVLRLPPFTSYAGPWYFYPENPDFKEISRLAFEKKTAAELIAQLPGRVFFRQNFRPEITNWLPFYWAGYRQTTRYTYRLDPAATREQDWENTLRTDLKKARARLDIYSDPDSPDRLFELYQSSLSHQNLPPSRRRAAFDRLMSVLRSRDQCRVLLARDRKTEQLVAGLWLAFDQREAALLLTGADSAGRRHAATPALMAAAIDFCREKQLILDFEGSMNEGQERLFRAFAGRLTPYFAVSKWL